MRTTEAEELEVRLDSSTSAIETAVETASQAIRDAAGARVNGDTDVSIRRGEVEDELKKLYYENSNNYNPYELKEKISEIVNEFRGYMSEEGNDFEEVVDAQVAIVETLITENTTSLAASITAAIATLNEEFETSKH